MGLFILALAALLAGGAYLAGFRFKKEGETDDDGRQTVTSSAPLEDIDPETAPTLSEPNAITEVMRAGEAVIELGKASGCPEKELADMLTIFATDAKDDPMQAFIELRRDVELLCTGVGSSIEEVPPPPPVFDAKSAGLPQLPQGQLPGKIRSPEDILREGALMVTRTTMFCGPTVIAEALKAQSEFIARMNRQVEDPELTLGALQQELIGLCPEAIES